MGPPLHQGPGAGVKGPGTAKPLLPFLDPGYWTLDPALSESLKLGVLILAVSAAPDAVRHSGRLYRNSGPMPLFMEQARRRYFVSSQRLSRIGTKRQRLSFLPVHLEKFYRFEKRPGLGRRLLGRGGPLFGCAGVLLGHLVELLDCAVDLLRPACLLLGGRADLLHKLGRLLVMHFAAKLLIAFFDRARKCR